MITTVGGGVVVVLVTGGKLVDVVVVDVVVVDVVVEDVVGGAAVLPSPSRVPT